MTHQLYALAAAGVHVLVDARSTGTPHIIYWGRDLGTLDADDLVHLAEAITPGVGPSSIDVPDLVTLLPTPSDGWTGRPGISGFRPSDGPRSSATWPQWQLTHVEATSTAIVMTLSDPAAHLDIRHSLQLTAQGLLQVDLAVTNTGDSAYTLNTLAATLPLPRRAREILDFSGRWTLERQPQRHPLTQGTWSRENRHGRPGHDAPFVLTVGTPGFSFRQGEMWSITLAWSGNSSLWAEHSPAGHITVAGAELLLPGEISLGPGELYAAPTLYAAWSDQGLDGISERFHGWVRHQASLRRALTPAKPRPVVLNTWEAVYFDQSLQRLSALAETAASVGVERFVLDDGWFRGRRSDRTSLGDWQVDPDIWPEGLTPLIDQVRSHGMEFGLWVEPEMISRDSELARNHPHWLLSCDSGRLPLPWRHQHILDLTHPEAYAYLHGALRDLLAQHQISFLKWDHNRDIIEGMVHAHTLAVYRLLDELHAEFPDVDIESCASGGARIDLGIMSRVDRFWTSDTNDAMERQHIQRWTSLLMPPEVLGSHVGSPQSHSTGRQHHMSFRLATALLSHAGIEWDLTTASPEDLAALREWTKFYRATRSVIASGTTVRCDGADDDTWVSGVVSPDRREAVFVLATMAAASHAYREPLRLAGLDPEQHYEVQVITFGLPHLTVEDSPPSWWESGKIRLRGNVLMNSGVALPALVPDSGVVFHITS